MSESSTNSKRVVVKGLPNIGSTCFMNSILQCLIWTPNFKEKLEELKKLLKSYQRKEKRKDRSEGFGHLTQSLSEIVKTAHKRDDCCWLVKFWRNHVVLKRDLKTFLQAIRNINSQFEGLRPQDSYEMFNTIIPGLEDEFKQHVEREGPLDNETSSVSEVFKGEFTTSYTYPCNHNEEVCQPFTSISIPVRESEQGDLCLEMIKFEAANSSFEGLNKPKMKDSPRQIFSLEDGLNEITQEEKIPLLDLPCNACTTIGNGNEYCVKQLLVSSTPEILVIHINRFKLQNGQLVKVQDEVKFPLDLDLSPFVMGNGQNTLSNRYSLYAVVCHVGPITGGHYYSLIKTFPGENVKCNWFSVSDRTVEPIESPLKTGGAAYILMYQRDQQLSQITSN